MGQIKFKRYYTELVEHYFRTAVRYKKLDCKGRTPTQWFVFTKSWIDKQSEEDKDFITFVFGKDFFKTVDGLNNFNSDEDMYMKRCRLASLETQFAIDSGLHSQQLECI